MELLFCLFPAWPPSSKTVAKRPGITLGRKIVYIHGAPLLMCFFIGEHKDFPFYPIGQNVLTDFAPKQFLARGVLFPELASALQDGPLY